MPVDFKHCVWALPASNHPWHAFIDSVPAHMSVRTGLSSTEARQETRWVRERLEARGEPCVRVHLHGNLRQTKTRDFYALEYAVRPDAGASVPGWWPQGAHVSFAYRQGERYSKAEMHAVEQRLLYARSAVLVHARTALCSGPASAWRVLDDSSQT